MSRIKCKNCKAGEHSTADEVRECWSAKPEPPRPEVKPELLHFIRTQDADFFKSLANYYERRGYLTERQVAAAEKAMQEWASLTTTNDAPEGVHIVYRYDEAGKRIVDRTIYKVQVAVHGSGRKYVKVFNPLTKRFGRCTERGVMAQLSDSTLVSAAEASAFGRLYGICVFCARTLTDERSIHVGYGATCADNQGLPWGELPTVDHNA